MVKHPKIAFNRIDEKDVTFWNMKVYCGVIVTIDMHLILLIFFQTAEKNQYYFKKWDFCHSPKKNFANNKTNVYYIDDTNRINLLYLYN